MESCSLFQDLSFSIEIAAHDVGLEHYAPRVYFDTINIIQRYHECFVPEEWAPPFNVHAEIEFEFSSLDTARAQFAWHAPGSIADSGAATLPSDAHEPLMINLKISFILDVGNLVPPSPQWEAYRHKVTAREQLEAGMGNLQRHMQRALGNTPTITSKISANSIGESLLCEFSTTWETAINAIEKEEKRQQTLEGILRQVHSGINAMSGFAQDITDDFEQNSKK